MKKFFLTALLVSIVMSPIYFYGWHLTGSPVSALVYFVAVVVSFVVLLVIGVIGLMLLLFIGWGVIPALPDIALFTVGFVRSAWGIIVTKKIQHRRLMKKQNELMRRISVFEQKSQEDGAYRFMHIRPLRLYEQLDEVSAQLEKFSA